MKFDQSFAADLVERSLRKGADQAEVFFRSYRTLSVEVKDQAVESLSSSFSSGYSVRVVRNSRLGFSFSTDPEECDLVIGRAIEAADASDEDAFLALPAPGRLQDVPVFDEAVRDMPEEEAVSRALEIEQAAFAADSRVTRVRKPAASFSVSETIIASSTGVNAQYGSTSCSAQATVVAAAGEDSQSGWDYAGSRFLRDVPFASVGATAARSAVRLLGARTMHGMRTGVILDAAVANDFLGLFAAALSAEAVQKGKSLLAGKLGSRVVSPAMNITDSGLLPGRLGSRPLDDEGVSTRTTPLIAQGMLLSYLFNTYTARKGNASTTGNAIRSGASSLPSVGITNLYLEPANPSHRAPADRMLRELGRGLYIVDAMGVHTANPISGDFSVGVTGLWIENGAVSHPVKEAVISGNLLELFGKVALLGDDLRFFGAIGSPSLLIPDVDLSA